MHWTDLITMVCLGLGAFLALTGSLGLLRMPDFYTRLHPAGKNDSLGQLLVVVGLCFQATHWMHVAKLLLIAGFLLLTAPTATHAITKAAWIAGLRPWLKPGDPQRDYSGNREDEHV